MKFRVWLRVVSGIIAIVDKLHEFDDNTTFSYIIGTFLPNDTSTDPTNEDLGDKKS
jgi:hypothetical protein